MIAMGEPPKLAQSNRGRADERLLETFKAVCQGTAEAKSNSGSGLGRVLRQIGGQTGMAGRLSAASQSCLHWPKLSLLWSHPPWEEQKPRVLYCLWLRGQHRPQRSQQYKKGGAHPASQSSERCKNAVGNMNHQGSGVSRCLWNPWPSGVGE